MRVRLLGKEARCGGGLVRVLGGLLVALQRGVFRSIMGRRVRGPWAKGERG